LSRESCGNRSSESKHASRITRKLEAEEPKTGQSLVSIARTIAESASGPAAAHGRRRKGPRSVRFGQASQFPLGCSFARPSRRTGIRSRHCRSACRVRCASSLASTTVRTSDKGRHRLARCSAMQNNRDPRRRLHKTGDSSSKSRNEQQIGALTANSVA
jgi:hypothetical protein